MAALSHCLSQIHHAHGVQLVLTLGCSPRTASKPRHTLQLAGQVLWISVHSSVLPHMKHGPNVLPCVHRHSITDLVFTSGMLSCLSSCRRSICNKVFKSQQGRGNESSEAVGDVSTSLDEVHLALIKGISGPVPPQVRGLSNGPVSAAWVQVVPNLLQPVHLS